MDKLGIIGGLGPMATVQFMEMLIRMTDASVDQEHFPMLVEHCPYIPDRTAYILGKSKENPMEPMLAAAKRLQKQGATELAIPCITAHYFHDPMQRSLRIPLIHGIEQTAEYLSEHRITTVGLMATAGTARTGMFTDMLRPYQISCVYPNEEMQSLVTSVIYDDIKAGKNADIDKVETVYKSLKERGAEVVLLGCTELSVINKDTLPTGVFLDVLEVLSQYCVRRFGRLKDEYRELIREIS